MKWAVSWIATHHFSSCPSAGCSRVRSELDPLPMVRKIRPFLFQRELLSWWPRRQSLMKSAPLKISTLSVQITEKKANLFQVLDQDYMTVLYNTTDFSRSKSIRTSESYYSKQILWIKLDNMDTVTYRQHHSAVFVSLLPSCFLFILSNPLSIIAAVRMVWFDERYLVSPWLKTTTSEQPKSD